MKHIINIKNNRTDEFIKTGVDSQVNSVEIVIDSLDRQVGIDIRVIYDLKNKTIRIVTDDHFNKWTKEFETFGHPED